MNNIINWIAVNNTLMIRTGFIAILALLIIYIFRYFFMPNVNMVNDSLDSGLAKDSASKTDSSFDEAELEKRKIVEKKQAEYHAAEIEKLLFEVSKLKDQLMDTNSLVTELKEKNQALVAAAKESAEAAPATGAAEGSGDGEASSEIVVNLKNKVENLEARLSEYEIIAEDISEIGQLRKENAELRKQIGSEPEVPVKNELSEELLVVDESVPEVEIQAVETPVENPIEEAVEMPIEAEAAVEVAVEAAAEPVAVVDAKEVTQNERDLIDHFEETVIKKGT